MADNGKCKDRLHTHDVVLDDDGRLLSWYRPQSHSYDYIIRLAWDFIKHKVPVERNGLKSYLSYVTFNRQPPYQGTDWPYNPADLYAGFADSLVGYYAYSGDRSLIDIVRQMLDHAIENGSTPSGWEWPNFPFSSGDPGAIKPRGVNESRYSWILGPGTGDGVGVLEPDKGGWLGLGYLKFYQLTSDERYLHAALSCADALAAHVKPGGRHHSPLPFRVFAWTGVVREEYTASMIGPLMLWDTLIELGRTSDGSYEHARDIVWHWVLRYPIRHNKWKGYYEDIGLDPGNENRDQRSALETAHYILEHLERDPEWKTHVSELISWVEAVFAEQRWGANLINEQLRCYAPVSSDTARYAACCARWYEVTGDSAYREKAYRAFNAATYWAREDGVVDAFAQVIREGDEAIALEEMLPLGPPPAMEFALNTGMMPWFSDGYADYVRHFVAGMGSVPEWAPPDQHHLLRSSSIVTDISYSQRLIEYGTFDPHATEVLRLASVPGKVLAGGRDLPRLPLLNGEGWTFDPDLGVLRVRHDGSRRVIIMAT